MMKVEAQRLLLVSRQWRRAAEGGTKNAEINPVKMGVRRLLVVSRQRADGNGKTCLMVRNHEIRESGCPF